MSTECFVCRSNDAQFVCPRCNARYCSLECYKNHSAQCTEAFHREEAAQELHLLTATDEDRRRMEEILRRLYEQQMEDAEHANASASDEEEEVELVPGLSLHRALLLAQGEISIEDLSADELAAFQSDLAAGGAAAVAIEPWQPWWDTDAAADLELSAFGTKIIQEIDAEEEPAVAEESIGRKEEKRLESALPPPPPAPLLPLSSLTLKPPSPALALHLLDLLYSYCLVLRLFNGQYSTDILDAAVTVLAASSVLGGQRAAPAAANNTSAALPSAVLRDLIVYLCSVDSGRAQVPRSFAIGLLSDVVKILQLGRAVVVTALMDLSRIMDGALSEARTRRGTHNVDKSTMTQLKQAQRKLLFFLSWANEMAEAVCPGLAAATLVTYEQQRSTLENTTEGGDVPDIINVKKPEKLEEFL